MERSYDDVAGEVATKSRKAAEPFRCSVCFGTSFLSARWTSFLSAR